MSGPYDFAVRECVVRRRADSPLRRARVHRIPHPTLVTIAQRPSSSGQDARKSAADLPDKTSGIFVGKEGVAAMRLMVQEK
jgi:hypothetical protein